MRPPLRSYASWNVRSPRSARRHLWKKSMSWSAPVRTRCWMLEKKSRPLKKVMSGSKSQKCSSLKNSSSSSGVRLAMMAATMDPTDDPTSTRGRHPRAFSPARATPTWNVPSVPHPAHPAAVRPKQCLVSCRNELLLDGRRALCAMTRNCARSRRCTRASRADTPQGFVQMSPHVRQVPDAPKCRARRRTSSPRRPRCARARNTQLLLDEVAHGAVVPIRALPREGNSPAVPFVVPPRRAGNASRIG